MQKRQFRVTVLAALCLSALGYATLTRWQAAAEAPASQESPDGVWRSQLAESVGLGAAQGISPSTQVYQLDGKALKELLGRAPLEATTPLAGSSIVLTAPKPDGSFARFRLVESPIMEPALAAKFPEIKTYLGQGIDDSTATIRCDLTPQGFHASIFAAEGTFFVEPIRSDLRFYRSYFKQGRGTDKDWQCFTNPADAASPAPLSSQPYVLSGATLRTYRLALAATGEYTIFQGGTVANALAAMVTSMNRVNGVYEREVGVRMILVANTNLIIYTDPNTDPYTNNSGSTMLGQNQSNLDTIIGSANYDIGHVFSTGGGGVASLRSVCVNGSKARGVTGSSSPTGDGFDIDYVAHEMGHQFGGNHTFNGTTSNCGGGNRAASAAYEPGSGTTIMAYAGICGAEDLQPHSDAYFHVKSLDEILTFIAGTGGGCAVATSTGNNPPTVSAGASFTIPQSTPFTLTASGSDPDNDPVTFCWEQFDLGAAAPPNTDNGNRPIFRSFTGTTNPSRTFPKLSDLLNNTATIGESLPTTTRALNFRVTARDNRAGGGGVRDASVVINSRADSGPFLVTAPNTAVSWQGNSAQTVTWDVANTTAAPVSCSQVNILLSTDGGNTFPFTLLSNAPNNGTATVIVPNVTTTQARIKVAAVGNIFFNLSNANFTITPGGGGCNYALNPTSQNFSAAGGGNTVNVLTSEGCAWTASSNAAWINITSGASGIGNGVVSYTVAPNADSVRSGSLTIAGRNFTVTQDGGVGGLQFYPLAHPIRLLDTRPGQQGCDAPQSPIPAGTARTQTAHRTCDGLTIPAGAAAITGNITTVESGGGYLTLYPSDAAQPLAANSNYGPNEILNNVFTVGLGNADGAFKIFVTSTTNVVIDVTGYYAPPGAGGLYFHPLLKPVRLLDTRPGTVGCFSPNAPLTGNVETMQQARGVCEGLTIPTASQAIVGNATTVNPAGPGFPYLTLFPADASRPVVASSNYLPGQVMNAPFTVGLSAAGAFKIFPTTQTDLVIDVLGYYSSEATDLNGAGLLFYPLPKPVRLLETRAGYTGCSTPGAPFASGSIRTQSARGACDGVTIAANALAIVGNATVVNATSGYLTFWPSDAVQPTVASSNFTAGQILNRHFTVGLGAGAGAFNIFTQFQTDLVIDVSGYFAP